MTQYLKRSWKINLLACVLTILAAGAQIFSAALLTQVLDVMLRGDFGRLAILMGEIALLWLALSFLLYFRDITQARALRQMHNLIRADVARSLVTLSPQEFHANDIGGYLSWFTNDINQLDESSLQQFYSMVSNLAIMVGCLIFLIWLHPLLLALCVFCALLMLVAPLLFRKRAEEKGGEQSRAQEFFVGRVKSLLEGFNILKAFNRSAHFLGESGAASDEVEQAKLGYRRFSSRMEATIAYIGLLCQFGILFLTAVLAMKNLVPYGAMLSIGNIAGFLCGAAQALANGFMAFSMGKPIFKKFHSIAAPPEAGLRDFSDFREKIELVGVGFSYPSKAVLENVSLTFEKGEKYALVGPSGCGKTTVLKLLLRFLNDYTGSILLDGQELNTFSPESLYRQISYIDQEVYLFHTTIRQNITLGEEFDESAIQKALEESALTGLIAEMPEGLETSVGENGAKLSGGQKQRIAIARALLHRQSILLMDEGTSALDQANAFEVESKLLQNPDLTVILVSHHLNPQLADRIRAVYDFSQL